MAVARLLLFALATQTLVIGQPATAVVDGIVTRAGTQEPLARTLLELRSLDLRLPNVARVYSFTTTADGRFTFTDVSPGRYQLTAMRQGFVRGDYGLRGPGASGVPLTLAPGQRLLHVRLSLVPTGTIAGRVTNPQGEGIGNVHVKALRYSYVEGRLTLVDVKSVFTNDLGDYRLGWLPPGRYNVSARHPDAAVTALNVPEVTNSSTGWANTAVTNAGGLNGGTFEYREDPDPAVRARIGLQPGEEYLPVYYPGTFDQRAASVIEVRPATDTSGMNIVLFPARTASIAGVVVASGSLPPLPTGGIPIAVSRNPTYSFQGAAIRSEPRTGSFTVAGLAPGSYVLAASLGSGDERIAGHTIVDVAEGGETHAQLTLDRGISIPVRVVIDGDATRVNRRTLRVSLRSDPLIPGMADTPSATPSDEGAAILRGITPGEYVVNVTPLMNRGRVTAIAPLPAVPGPGSTTTVVNLPSGESMFLPPGVVAGAVRLDGPASPLVELRDLLADQSAAPERTATAYVKSIRLGDLDLLNSRLRVEGRVPNAPIEIVLGTRLGAINGAVVDDRGAPQRATVVLMPPDAMRHRLDLYRSVVTDEGGRFRIEGIVPEDYRLYAWEDVETGAWLDAQFMSTIDGQGTRALITEDARVAMRLVAIRQR